MFDHPGARPQDRELWTADAQVNHKAAKTSAQAAAPLLRKVYRYSEGPSDSGNIRSFALGCAYVINLSPVHKFSNSQ